MAEKINYEAVLDEAFQAAAKATAEYHDKYGQTYPCGFAWAKIRPARGPLVTAIKKYCADKKERTGLYVDNGLVVYNPSRHWTQALSAKELGADAFIAVLEKHKLVNVKDEAGNKVTPTAYTGTRWD